MIERRPSRSGFAYARLATFLLAFALLLIIVCQAYLFPTMRAWQNASPDQRKVISAHTLLLLVLLLVVLLIGLLLSLRLGRLFAPKRRPKAKPTNYPDAWAESARRIQVDPADDEPE